MIYFVAGSFVGGLFVLLGGWHMFVVAICS